MQKKDFEAVAEALKRAQQKTTAAIKDFLRELDGKNETEALAGKRLTARARITALFDEGTFVETGAYIKRRATEFDPDAIESDDFEAVITGYGSVNGSLVYAFAEDHFRSKGAVGEAHAKKICALYDMAIANGAPVVGIFDSNGAFILEGTAALSGYGKVMSSVSKASGVIPQIAVIAGTCAGSAAVIASMFDVTVLSELDGKFYVTKNNASVPAITVADEISAIIEAKLLLSILPANNCEGTVRYEKNANGAVDVSYIKDGGYDVHSVIASVADDGNYKELYAALAPEMVIALSSVGGTVTGIVATNPAVNGGKLTSDAAKKASRLVSLCDSFNIPVVTLVDTKGLDSENAPDANEIAKLAFAYTSSECAKVTVVTGESYGSAYTVLGSKSVGSDITLALDSAVISAMPAESAVALLWDEKFEGTTDPAARRAELVSEWNATFGSAVDAAYKGEIDDIIESSELRARIAAALEMLSMKSAGDPVRRHINLPL